MSSKTVTLQPNITFAADDLHIARTIPVMAQAIVTSSALLDLSAISIRNVPYALYGDNLGMNTFGNAVTARISYGESGLRSLVSLVYNVAVAGVFSALAIVTLGQSSKLNNVVKRYWVYSGLAATCALIGGVGVISPWAAVKSSLGLAALCALQVLDAAHRYAATSAERDLLLVLKKLFQELKPELAQALPEGIDIKEIDAQVMKADRVSKLVVIGDGVYQQLLQHA